MALSLERNNDVMTVEYHQKRLPEFSAVEECWKQGKDDLLISKILSQVYKSKISYYRLLYDKMLQFEYRQIHDESLRIYVSRYISLGCVFLFTLETSKLN
jgi:hypothetical protein